jgi:hypothetical protein
LVVRPSFSGLHRGLPIHGKRPGPLIGAAVLTLATVVVALRAPWERLAVAEPADHLMSRADQALYDAKREGHVRAAAPYSPERLMAATTSA